MKVEDYDTSESWETEGIGNVMVPACGGEGGDTRPKLKNPKIPREFCVSSRVTAAPIH